jgi:LemA protein
MSKSVDVILGALGLIAVVGVLYAVSFYNGLVSQSQAIDGQWAQVETQYQRRFDLIPNLVSSVKGIFAQEQEVFGSIAEARTRYAGATTVNEKAQAAGELETALGRLLVIVENYPQLQSNQAVLQLMDDLAGTENRISVERRRYNDLVRSYNTTINRIPGKFFASMLGFEPRAFFKSAEGAAQAPAVEF